MGALSNPAERYTRNFRRLLHGTDTRPFLRRIAEHPELWSQITARQSYEGTAHADTETIFLRAPARTQNVFDCIETVPMPALATLGLDNTLGHLMRELGLRDLGRAMLVKLKANGVIHPHTDRGAYARYFSRFHFVLSTSPHCLFYADAESVHMAAGEVWWFNHQVEHEVVNGSQERIHLIFDGCAPGFTGALL